MTAKLDPFAAAPELMKNWVRTSIAIASSLDPKLAEAYIQLGIMSSANGDNARAIIAYKKAIDVNPQSGEAHYRLGLAYKRIGEDAKAQQELQLYKQIDQTETAAVESQRRELRQFMIILKEQPAPAALPVSMEMMSIMGNPKTGPSGPSSEAPRP